MKTKALGLLAAIAVLLSVAPPCAHTAPSDDVARIGLTAFSGLKVLQVSCPAGLSIGSGTKTNGVTAASLALENGRLTLNISGKPAVAETPLVISPQEPGALVTLESTGRQKRTYRGSIEIALSGDSLRVVNVVRVEEYLLGVLPSEMPDTYPEESLKAQAIAARTYYYANRNKHAALGYELCDSTDCQSYQGTLLEKPRCSRAVEDTQGQLLTFEGKPASVFYSSDCGGVTRNYSETRPHFHAPYLVSVVEPQEIKHSEWQKDYKLSELEKMLTAAGIKEASGLKHIAVSRTDSAGWAQDVSIEGSRSVSIPADRIRSMLGPGNIKSTFFRIEIAAGGTVSFKGKGCGHGWGMCQVGAKALAQAPYSHTYTQILGHYFPGTIIQGTSNAVDTNTDVAMVAGDGTGPMAVVREPASDLKLPKKQPSTLKPPFDVRLQEP